MPTRQKSPTRQSRYGHGALTLLLVPTLVIFATHLGAAPPAKPQTAPVTRLEDAPANRWVRITDFQTGYRRGSAVFYSQALGQFVLAQGVTGDAKRKVVRPYDVQVLSPTRQSRYGDGADPAKAQWINWYPPGKEQKWGQPTGAANPPGFPHSVNYFGMTDKEGNVRPPGNLGMINGYAVDPDGSGLYVYVRGYSRLMKIKPGAIWRYDVKQRSWAQFAPEHKIDAPSFGGPPNLVGARLVYEPVNKELLLLCGQAPNVAHATVGNWAFSLESKTWARLTYDPAGSEQLQRQFAAWRDKLTCALGRARSIHYAVVGAEKQAGRVKAEVAPDVALVREQALKFLKGLGEEVQPPATSTAARRLLQIDRDLESLAARLEQGQKLSGKLLAKFAAAARSLDWATRQLADEPTPRANPAVCYDPANKVVVLFGGDRFDGVLGDTWVYNPADRSWKQAYPATSPPPRALASLIYLPTSKKLALVGGRTINHRFVYFSGLYETLPADVWLYDVKANTWELAVNPPGKIGFDMPNLPSPAAAGPDDVIVGLSEPVGWPNRAEGGTWAVKVDAAKTNPEAARTLGKTPGAVTSRAITWDKGKNNFVYDPAWYDQAEFDPAATQAWLEKLPANKWVEVPRAPRHVPQSEWGTAVFDPLRDRIYYWTGGHMSDPANAVHTYHPAINRWSIPYVAEISIAKGRTFNDRPDCKNHTYHNYAFDPVSGKVVAATYGGTGVYDPDTGRWNMTLTQPFRRSHYTMNLFTTPKGILVWAEGFFGRFDVATMQYTPIKLTGRPGRYLGPDANGAVWDTKRKVMWMFAKASFKEASGQVHRLDLETNTVTAMDPTNATTVGKAAGYLRELVYLPNSDLVLTKTFRPNKAGGRQIAYDPAKNRWVRLNVAGVGRVLGPVAMVYDAKRDLVWCMSGSRLTYVLKIDPATLEASDKLDAGAEGDKR